MRSLLSFAQSREKDFEIDKKVQTVKGLVKEIQLDKHQQLQKKVKLVLNMVLYDAKEESLFQTAYKRMARQSAVEWVPLFDKVMGLLDQNSQFLKIVNSAQQQKISIEKMYIPNYLFRNNILNSSAGYLGITNSVTGLVVPVLDYVFIRLSHAISQLGFINLTRQANTEYVSDDLYFHLNRNPYLVLFRKYLNFYASKSQNSLKRLVGCAKMYFVDELIMKYRLNKSSSYIRDSSFGNSNYKLSPNHLMVIFLLLKKGRNHFEEKDLYFSELIQRYKNIVEKDNAICFRFLLRTYLWANAKHSIESRVIDEMEKANSTDGCFELLRYSVTDFQRSIRNSERDLKAEHSNTKSLLLQLLESDQNLVNQREKNFSLLRNLGCFLVMEAKEKEKQSLRNRSVDDVHRTESQAKSVGIGLQKLHRSVTLFLNKSEKQLSKQNRTQLLEEMHYLTVLYKKVYNRQIDFKRSDQRRQDNIDRSFNIRGSNGDYVRSLSTYRADIDENVWRVPPKDSEFEILYNLFLALARKIDRYLPGENKSQYPRVNLRFLCNPIVFMLIVTLFILLGKVIL